MPGSLRVFVAVEVPLAHRRAVHAATEELRSRLPGARWTPVENQHVTLKFLGWTPEEDLERVTEACLRAAAEGVRAEARVAGMGAFPNTRRARVLWAGIDDPSGLFGDLAGALDDALEPMGFVPEKRSFTPHLTLARFKQPAPVRAVVEAVELQPLPFFRVEELVLWRSFLSPKGARYEPLTALPLG